MSGCAKALEDASRAALRRRICTEENHQAEARRAAELAIEARVTLQVRERVHRAIVRLHPLVSRVEDHLRNELRDAAICGDNARSMLLERELDALFHELNEAMRAEVGR